MMKTSKYLFRSPLPAEYAINGYRIEFVLGKGAFGITYRAHDFNLNRTVAIKEYLPRDIAARGEGDAVQPLTTDAELEFKSGLKRFIAEARTLGQFQHPNIVQVHNVFQANGTAYMVMRYEEGETLSNILKLKSTLTEREVLQIIFPLLSGLEAVHAAGFIHRDIKPANIFLRTNGSPILLDFGSARQALDSPARELTNLVTDGYAPIEQYTGRSDHQGPWTDIYGLGATLYRAVTGQAPIDAVDRGASLATDDTDTLESGVDRAGGRYRDDFLKAIDYALQFKIRDRPQSIDEWRSQLNNEPVKRESRQQRQPPRSIDKPALIEQQADVDAGETRQYMLAPTPHAVHRQFRPIQAIKNLPARTVFANLAFVIAIGVVALMWPNHEYGGAIAPSPSPVVLDVERLAMVELLLPPADIANKAPEPLPSEPTLEDILASAARDLGALKLTRPDGDNAYEKYRQVLAVDADNATALAGIETVAAEYIRLAGRRLEAGELDVVELYIAKALSISPGVGGVGELRDEITSLQVTDEVEEQIIEAMIVYDEPRVITTKSFADRVKQFVLDDSAALSEDRRSNQFLRQIGGGARR